MAAVQPTSGRVTFTTTPEGSRTVYESPPDPRYQPTSAVTAAPTYLRDLPPARIVPTAVGGGGSTLLTTPVNGGNAFLRGGVMEVGGDVIYKETGDIQSVAAPAPTRVVNPPPFGYAGVIYDKGQHRGQARADQPPPLEVRHHEDTVYGSRVMYAPQSYPAQPAAATEGVAPQDGFPSRIVSRTVYPSRVVHADGSGGTEDRGIPQPGLVLSSGVGVVSQQGYLEPRVAYEDPVGTYARRGGNLHQAAAAASHPATQGMPWNRDFANLPPTANIPWSDVTYAQMPSEKLVGYTVPPLVGLRVVLSQQGLSVLKHQAIGPALCKGRPGHITQVNSEKDAVMVQWDAVDRAVEGASGWYRIGAYGEYTLAVAAAGNRDEEILRRSQMVADESYFSLGVTEIGF